MTTIFTGTAAELAELTRKHWGAEWWPLGLELHPFGYWCYLQHGHQTDAGTVAATILAVAMVHMANRGMCPELSQSTDGSGMWWLATMPAREIVAKCGPSPLHAVLAAVEACKLTFK